jgi:hypothetical protein
MEAGRLAGWSFAMEAYYCELPANPQRKCFTYSVKGIFGYRKRSYEDAYVYCYTSEPGQSLKWVHDNQDRVFRAVMIDRKF